MDRVHDRDLGLLRGLHNIHDASSRIRYRLPRMIDLVRSAVNGAILSRNPERTNGPTWADHPAAQMPWRGLGAASAARRLR
jgi:hypothetical protein